MLPRYGLDELWYVPQYARAVGEQTVRAPALAYAWGPWHGPYIASGIEGVAGSYEGPTLLWRLDDHDGRGEAGDDAVSGREAPREGRLAEVVLGDQGPMPPDRLEEPPVTPRVDDREAAGDPARGYPLTAEGAYYGLRVDGVLRNSGSPGPANAAPLIGNAIKTKRFATAARRSRSGG